jgi:hypothetical protein
LAVSYPTAVWESMCLTGRGFTGFEPRQKSSRTNFVGISNLRVKEDVCDHDPTACWEYITVLR